MIDIRCRAPLRLSFGGGGTDVSPYPETKGGIVISTTIDRYAYVTIRKNSDKILRINSQDFNLLETFKSVSALKQTSKLNLVRAAFSYMKINKIGFDVVLQVDSPPGSGLGTSSAITVALIGAISQLKNKSLTPYELAHAAYVTEREVAMIKGGMQDQYASTFGGLNLIEFKKNSVIVNPLRLRPEIQNELFASLILCDTGSRHLSAKILSRQIDSYKRKDKSVMESLDKIKHLALEVKNSLLKGDLNNFGELLDYSWHYKKNLDKKITNPKIEKIYNTAKNGGAIGGKLLGAGGGGHMLFVSDLENKVSIIKKLTKIGCKIIKFNFDQTGVQIWKVNRGKVI